MVNVERMIDDVRNYLDENDWNYEYDAGMQLIRTGVSIKGKLQSVRMLIRFTEDGYSSFATIQMHADENTRPAIAEYITRINYGAKNGNFEMDYSDGEIRYKVYTNYKGMDSLPKDIIEDSIVIPAMMFNRFGDGMAALLFGFSTPEEEVNKARN